MTKEQELLFSIIRMADFTEHRQNCYAQEEALYQEIEEYLKSNEIKDYRLPGVKKNNIQEQTIKELKENKVVQPERLSEETNENCDFCNKRKADHLICDHCLGEYQH